MIIRNVICSALVVTFGCFVDGDRAHAKEFDALGLHQNMARSDVEAFAKNRGYQITPGPGGGWQLNPKSGRTISVAFCNDSLRWLSWSFDGELLRALQMVKDYKNRLGYTLSRTDPDVRVGYDGKAHGLISFVLYPPRPPEYSLEISLHATEGHDITNGQVQFRALEKCPHGLN
jgi:hypothetical protein